ncbi:IS607 family transposase [Ileibacterium valens]|uniref:IS607 family transposase n=1 Tax=Ileibacterium valens TaxID=1862668 RepID=UPI0024B9AE49|nr:IS607 family transposase [Ileibacterium valens]
MEKRYKIGEFALMIGVSVQTLRKWEKAGKLTSYRSPGGVRYYTHQQYLELTGGSVRSSKTEETSVIYVRVSTRNQKDDLKNQAAFLRQFCNARGIIVSEVIEDYGSGLDYNRKKLNNLLNQVMDRKVSQIVIAHKDRFVRFGYDWFERLCERFGCRIIVVNNEELSPEKELVEDIMAILHMFSDRLHGLRKYRKMIKEDDSLTKE